MGLFSYSESFPFRHEILVALFVAKFYNLILDLFLRSFSLHEIVRLTRRKPDRLTSHRIIHVQELDFRPHGIRTFQLLPLRLIRNGVVPFNIIILMQVYFARHLNTIFLHFEYWQAFLPLQIVLMQFQFLGKLQGLRRSSVCILVGYDGLELSRLFTLQE